MRPRLVRRCAVRGFTLIELLLVLVILTALAAIVVPRFKGVGQRARVTQATTDIKNLTTALSAFEVDNGRYPTSEEGLNALSVQPSGLTNWHGPYLEKAVGNDPWGNPYVYACPGAHNTAGFDLHSCGPTGQEGADDNIDNWTVH